MVSIDVKRAFTENGKNISLSKTEVFLRTANGDLEKSKKLRNWISRNAVLLLPFLTDAVVTDKETAAEALLKNFAEKIHNHEVENTPEETDED